MLKNKKLFKFFSGLGAIILLGSVSCNILAMNPRKLGKHGQHKLSNEERQRRNDLKAQKREIAAKKRRQEEEKLQRQELERAKEEYEAGREERERIAKLKADEIERRKRERDEKKAREEAEKHAKEEEERQNRIRALKNKMDILVARNSKNFRIEMVNGKDCEEVDKAGCCYFNIEFFCYDLTKNIIHDAFEICKIWNGVEIKPNIIRFKEIRLTNVRQIGISDFERCIDAIEYIHGDYSEEYYSEKMYFFRNHVCKLIWVCDGNIDIRSSSFMFSGINEVEIYCGGKLTIKNFSFAGSKLNKLKIISQALFIETQGFSFCEFLQNIDINCDGNIEIQALSFDNCYMIFDFMEMKEREKDGKIQIISEKKGNQYKRHVNNNVSVNIKSTNGVMNISSHAITKTESKDFDFDEANGRPTIMVIDKIDVSKFFTESNVKIIKENELDN